MRWARSAPVGVGGERRELVAHAEQDVGPLRVHGRLVEPAEPDAAGQVTERRVARLRDATEALQQRARPTGELARSAGSRGSSEPSRAETSATSGVVRCWARKMRKTAASSSGVRSRSSTP